MEKLFRLKILTDLYYLMVDRYKSLIEEQGSGNKKKKNSSILLDNKNKGLNDLIKKTEISADNMKKCIGQYREATTPQQEKENIAKFKEEEDKLHNFRQQLVKEYKNMGGGESNPQKMLIKEQLLKTVQKSLKLDVEMNELMNKKSNQLQIEMKKLSPGSEKLKNALSDLTQKRNQIIYLQEQVKECVQLLEIIGVLVLENTQKIQTALQQVKQANIDIDRSLKVIEKAKLRTEKSRKRMCCIIILGLITIIVILVVLFGFVLKF